MGNGPGRQNPIRREGSVRGWRAARVIQERAPTAERIGFETGAYGELAGMSFSESTCLWCALTHAMPLPR